MRKPLLIAALVLLMASPAFALSEVVTWTNPDPAASGFSPATGIRVDSGPTAATLVNGPVLPTTATTTTITAGLVLGQVTCTQISWVNAFGDNKLFAVPVCSPAGGLASKGSNATIIFIP